MHRSSLAWAAIDFLSALLLVIYVLVAPTHARPHIQTFGLYAITIEWKGTDDVDLWVREPDGKIVFWLNQRAGLMHLENDDIPEVSDQVTVNGRTIHADQSVNRERTILVGVVPGEYVVNLHVYRKLQTAPSVVTVRLFRLQGEDRLLHTQIVRLRAQGQQVTAFRFTPRAGGATDYNRLFRSFVSNP